MPQLPGFVGPSYAGQSFMADAERLVNWYVEILESPNAKSRMALYPSPGLRTFATATNSPGRGIFAQSGRCWAVYGSTVYEVMANGTMTARGTVALDSNPATLITNGDGGHELLIVSGGRGYILDLVSNVFTASVVTNVTQGDMLDGFFLALDASTSTLKISNLFNGLTWDPLNIQQRSVASDPWKAVIVSYKDIWLLGEQTSEVWYDAGLSPFPFLPRPGVFFEQGIAAPFSLAKLDNTIVWLSQNSQGSGIVLQAQGYTPQRVSTFPLEYAIQNYAVIDDAVGFSYQEAGHFFYVLTFPAEGATWVFDNTTRMWHERGSWDIKNNKYQAGRPQSHAYVFGKHLITDRNGSDIYEMAIDIGTDFDGAGLRRVRRSPYLTDDPGWLFHDSLSVGVEPGLGLSSGQGSTPEMMLRYSDDFAKTWGNVVRVGAGAIGQYYTCPQFNRLGRSRGNRRVYELVVTDPTPWRITGVDLTITRGQG